MIEIIYTSCPESKTVEMWFSKNPFLMQPYLQIVISTLNRHFKRIGTVVSAVS